MPLMVRPDVLAQHLRTGLMCFPLTDFDADGRFDRPSFAARLGWQLGYSPRAVFAAGGAGEFFSLSFAEYSAVVEATVAAVEGRCPVIASSGYGTALAIDYAREAERLGCSGILLLPPYLAEGPQDGLIAHVDAVCKSVGIGVIVYNRANCVLNAASIARLADANRNFIAVKDGHGDTEELLQVKSLVGDRITLINGMPTAEVYAGAYFGMGVPAYSSAIFNFLPRSALNFYAAVRDGDARWITEFQRTFLMPYCEIRRRRPGYAVSIVKAGVDLIGRSAGKVRPPLADLSASEREALAGLIERAGPQT
jgi:5-dehydro-4-deoxyglucarate dehydratase